LYCCKNFQIQGEARDGNSRTDQERVYWRAGGDGTALLGMKPMGDKNILRSNTVTPLECLQYALSRPTSVVITGIDSMAILDQAFQAAATYSKLSPADIDAMLRKTAAAADGRYEPFKTTASFDSTAQHPEWMG
jgi:hypothetical protein